MRGITLDEHWVKAEDVLLTFSKVRSFVSGSGLPRVSANYWFCLAERRVRGEISFGVAAEGMPGCVHGGAISGVFDEALGLLSWAMGNPVVTRQLNVRFERFVPVDSVVTVEGQLAEPEGWIIHGDAIMRDSCLREHATVRASFVELDPEIVAEFGERNASRLRHSDELMALPESKSG